MSIGAAPNVMNEEEKQIIEFHEFLDSEYSAVGSGDDRDLVKVQDQLYSMMKVKNEGTEVYSSALSVRYR
ncbi:MAG: hypothetical protein KDC12_10860 [Flavobacteriales bacterium]|nr:hypothetical protein [Flavobacteriales bacterium]